MGRLAVRGMLAAGVVARAVEQAPPAWTAHRPVLPRLERAPAQERAASGSVAAGSGLFVGVDAVTIPTWFIDPADGTHREGFTGTEVWAAARVRVDADHYLLFIVSGSELAVSIDGQPPSTCCTLSLDGIGGASATGAAFQPAAGRLLFSRNISPRSIYSLQ